MYGDSAFLLAQTASDLITLEDRLRLPFQHHKLQLAVSVCVGVVLGVLGCFVILRRMALIGDAISHAVLPGVVVAFIFAGTGMFGLLAGALVAGALTAIGINLVTRYSRIKEDASIGIVFTAMFALGVVLISALPQGTHFDLKCFLFGDPLAVQANEARLVALITPIVLLTIAVLFHPLKLISFDPIIAATMGFNTTALHYLLMILLSATIVAALSSVGVIMAIAMLVTPAAVAYQLTNRLWRMLVISGVCGGLSALTGMYLAFIADTPPGPTMVLAAAGIFIITMIFAPQRGLLMAWLLRRRIRQHIVQEDVLKLLARGEEDGTLRAPAEALAGPTRRQIVRAISQLRAAGMLAQGGERPVLSERGRTRATQLMRAHRLWESFLHEHDIRDPAMHAEAERLEHAHDLTEEIAETLGDPQRDPHGAPIPPRA